MSVDTARERGIDYMLDGESNVANDFWWAQCLDARCGYEFESASETHPICPMCEGDGEVV